jgi:hypothetical protein
MIIIAPRKKKLPNKLKFGGWKLLELGTLLLKANFLSLSLGI